MAIEPGQRVYHRRADFFGVVVERGTAGALVRYDSAYYKGPDALVPVDELVPEDQAFRVNPAIQKEAMVSVSRDLLYNVWDAVRPGALSDALRDAAGFGGPALQTRPANAPGAQPGASGAILETTTPKEEFDQLVEFWLVAYGEVRRFLDEHQLKGVPDEVAIRWKEQVDLEALKLTNLTPFEDSGAFAMDAGRDARGALIIHSFPAGWSATRCGLMGPPRGWPPGNFYERNHRLVNCPICRAALDPVGHGG